MWDRRKCSGHLCKQTITLIGKFAYVVLNQESPRGTALVVQWLRLRLPMQGVQAWSLVGKLRSHMPQGQKNQNMKQKHYCNKFNKDFKYDPHFKKSFKKITKNLAEGRVKRVTCQVLKSSKHEVSDTIWCHQLPKLQVSLLFHQRLPVNFIHGKQLFIFHKFFEAVTHQFRLHLKEGI